MKTFIVAALTADGLIGKDSNHQANWTSKGDKGFFVELTKRAGVMIMGMNTWKTIDRAMENRLKIVYTKENLTSDQPDVRFTQKDPAELLKELGNQGYEEIAIIGGQQIFTLFLEQNLVDTIYLTIEPVIFGSGMTLFNKPIFKELEFKSIKVKYLKKHNTNTVLLEYNIVK
ncbi:MAG: dihydrofolate reductase [Candidatus Wildermuthbacteria bacterium]|nr:dihydrofolate reductase [Candidatus Wildermuthbacteria bacterium]